MSTQPLDHIVITRFAVRLPGSPPPSSEWVTSRFDLFERYCLASMRAQTERRFTWLLLIDPELDADLAQRVRAYESESPAIRVRTVAAGDAPGAIPARVAELVPPRPSLLLTTRLDNDDAVSTDFVERVRAAALMDSDEVPHVYVFTSGFELSEGRLYWRSFPRSPFASLLEQHVPGRAPTTIMAAEHEAVDQLAPVRAITDPPAWIQVVHAGNVLNRIRGVRVSRKRLAGRFVIDDPAVGLPESQIELAFAVPFSAMVLGWRLVTTPRYWRKVRDVLRLR